jgi:hypothetical protein
MDGVHWLMGWKQKDRANLHVEGFNANDKSILIGGLSRMGINANVQNAGKYSIIQIPVDSVDTFFTLIAPYIHPQMRYKLPSKYHDVPFVKGNSEDISIGLRKTTVVSVSEGEQIHRYQYDLHTNNENYFAEKCLVHNTNILAFKYIDDKGNECISYKTRRMPFVGDDFLYMWKDVLKKHPDIPEIVKKNNMSMAFELYGKTNLHGIIYDIDLDARVLLEERPMGRYFPPRRLIVVLWGFPK